MLFISHRGNIEGPNPSLENYPGYIEKTLKMGFDVEIDVWVDNINIYLGHDSPKYKIDLNYLKNDRFWCHAKSLETLTFLLENNIRCFWHERDSYTLTSDGWIWTFPSENINRKCILVMPELSRYGNSLLVGCGGICSNFIEKYSKQLR